MKASHIIDILVYLATEAEDATAESSVSKAKGLFLDEQFARHAHVLTFFADHRLMGAGPDDIAPGWKRLTEAMKRCCDILPDNVAEPMRKFLKGDSSRLLDEHAARGVDGHVSGIVPVVRGKVVKNFLKAGMFVADNLLRTGRKADRIKGIYGGSVIPEEDVSYQDLRELSFELSAEASEAGVPFFFHPGIASGLFKLAHGRIGDQSEFKEQQAKYRECHDKIQKRLFSLFGEVMEIAGWRFKERLYANRADMRNHTFRPRCKNAPALRGPQKLLYDFRMDFHLMQVLAEMAVQHIQSLPEDAVNWDNQCDKYSIEIARKALYEYGFDDYADGNVPTGLTVEQFFMDVEAEEPDAAEAPEVEEVIQEGSSKTARLTKAANQKTRGGKDCAETHKPPPRNRDYRNSSASDAPFIRAEYRDDKQYFRVFNGKSEHEYCITACGALKVVFSLLEAFNKGDTYVDLSKKFGVWSKYFGRGEENAFKNALFDMEKNGGRYTGRVRIKLEKASASPSS